MLIKPLAALEEQPGQQTEAMIAHTVKMDLLIKDKGLLDKATNGFVSFLRYYKEHQLAYIFALKELDIGAVANSFFLFRLPRVKEILGKRINSFVQANAYEGVSTTNV